MIVGKISMFAKQLEDIGQTNLSSHIEAAYEIAKKVSPATNEVIPILN